MCKENSFLLSKKLILKPINQQTLETKQSSHYESSEARASCPLPQLESRLQSSRLPLLRSSSCQLLAQASCWASASVSCILAHFLGYVAGSFPPCSYQAPEWQWFQMALSWLYLWVFGRGYLRGFGKSFTYFILLPTPDPAEVAVFFFNGFWYLSWR